jgi:hypothetical protein
VSNIVQANNLETVAVIPSTSTCVTDQTTPSISMQSELTQPNRNVSNRLVILLFFSIVQLTLNNNRNFCRLLPLSYDFTVSVLM